MYTELFRGIGHEMLDKTLVVRESRYVLDCECECRTCVRDGRDRPIGLGPARTVGPR